MNNPCIKYLRPLKGKTLLERYDLFTRNRRKLRHEVIEDAVVNPHADIDGIVTPMSKDASGFQALPLVEESVLVAGDLNPHWGHFLMDSLPNLWLAFQPDHPDFDAIVFTLKDCREEELHPNIIKTLTLTGLADRIRFVTEPTRYRSAIHVDKAVEPRHHFAEEALPVYDAISANVDDLRLPTKGEKIFMSRQRFKKGIVNEPFSEWADHLFDANGYRIIYPEEMDITDLIATLRGAKSVTALAGTLPHNMVFAHSGTELIIIEKTPAINNYQQGIDLVKKLHTVCIDANAMIKCVDPGLGPFIIYPNHLMRGFCSDRAFSVRPKEWSEMKRRNTLRKFFTLFRRHYSRQWILPEWMECEIGILREAYADSFADFGVWLDGKRPVFLSDLLSPRRCAKFLLFKILHKSHPYSNH